MQRRYAAVKCVMLVLSKGRLLVFRCPSARSPWHMVSLMLNI